VRAAQTQDIHLQAGGVLAPPLPARHGITRAELRGLGSALRPVLPELLGGDRPSGFALVPRRKRALAEILASARRWRRRGFADLIHIGIGGSSLGAETLFRALAHPFHNQLPPERRRGPRIHFVDNVDPDSLAALLELVDVRRSFLHVVSKSGGTVETAAGFQVLQRALQRAGVKRLADHAVFTTGQGALRKLAGAEGVEILEFPEDVGGRYSALTPSGLFTPAVAGVDVAAVCGGAARMLRRLAAAPISANPAAVAAGASYLLAERHGKPVHVLMPYGDALEPLSRWYVQLAGESLGKRRPGSRRGVGPTPLPARGATDQHSQLQLFVEGPPDKLVVFVDVARPRRRVALPGTPPAPYLKGVSAGQLLRAEREGTAVALARAGRPSLTWELPAAAPECIGQLLFALQLQTAYQAALYGIDAYDQPGVEAGKVAANALIGRAGYEAERAAIEAGRPPDWRI
jgi:glucose-6-phosphate isomerase